MKQKMKQSILYMILALLVALIPYPKSMDASSSGMYNHAHQTVNVLIHNKIQPFSHPAYLTNGKTVGPVREFLEAIGAQVTWNSKKQTITAKKGNMTVILTAHSHQATVNGKSYRLKVPVQLTDGKAFAPLRFLAESFQAQVQWNNQTKTASITLSPLTVKEAEQKVRSTFSIPKDFKVEHDHDEVDGIYVFHAYQIVHSSASDSHTSTFGWYRINAQTGIAESLF